MRHHRLTRSAALGLALVAFAVPTAAAQQDLRSPDARDAAAAPAPQTGQDLRSPDARDAAADRGTFSAPEVAVVKLEQPAPSAPSSGGLDWSAAVIGAGTVVGLMLVALGAVAVVNRRNGVRSATAA